jgi:hypothetical protein
MGKDMGVSNRRQVNRKAGYGAEAAGNLGTTCRVSTRRRKWGVYRIGASAASMDLLTGHGCWESMAKTR